MAAPRRTKRARAYSIPRPSKSLVADTTPTKEAVVRGVTRDASTDETIFDLLDNAIDAARNDLLARKKRFKLDDRGLPAHYDGYHIEVSFRAGRLRVADNCGGIDAHTLSKIALRFGQPSNHPYGIGTYGVGLNRAIFRLGRKAVINTGTESSAYEIVIDADRYIASESWELPAKLLPKGRSSAGTAVDIHLLSDVATEVASHRWLSSFIAKAEWRYARLLSKELEIVVEERSLKPRLIRFRDNSAFYKPPLSYADGDVRVFIEIGEHHQHRFKKELGSSQSVSRQLTPQYGWNVACNDRAILIADKTTDTGWPPVWHPEYNGFVGYVSFVSLDPALLPWDTKKTGLDNGHPVFARAVKIMTEFAAEWRRFSRTETRGKTKGSRDKSVNGATTATTGSKPDSDHTRYTTVLPADFDELGCEDKLLRLIREAKELDIERYSYSGLLLIRTLFELSAIHYLRKKKRFGHFKDQVFERKNKEREKSGKAPLPGDFKLNYRPEFEEICEYFTKNGEVWGPDDFAYAKPALDKAKGHRGFLNEVAHDPTGLVSRTEAKKTRDAIVPLLRHLLKP